MISLKQYILSYFPLARILYRRGALCGGTRCTMHIHKGGAALPLAYVTLSEINFLCQFNTKTHIK